MTDINYCNQCPTKIRGMCCYYSFFDGEENFILFPCEHLSKKTRRCKVYKNRFIKNPGCLSVEEMLKQGAIPEECAYHTESPHIQPIRPYKTINNKKRDELKRKLKKKIS